MNTNLSIISLLPSATEIVYLLGLGDFLIARSHDSNYPEEVLLKPIISEGAISQDLSSKMIDESVRKSIHTGRSLFHIDQNLLIELKLNLTANGVSRKVLTEGRVLTLSKAKRKVLRPKSEVLILTQELCAACAPNFHEAKRAARLLKGSVTIISLEPESVDDMLENILMVGETTHRVPQARTVIEKLKNQLKELSKKVSNVTTKPSVIIIEWMDPIMIAGHWVPEMVERAGGRMLIARSKEKSKRVSWDEIIKENPDILIIAPCGFSIERAKREMSLLASKPAWDKLKAVQDRRVFFVDGDAYLTRSGPRLIEGCKILARIFHPQLL